MKRQVATLLIGMLLGGALFGTSVRAQTSGTTEERLAKLEAIVDGDASTVTAGTFRTSGPGVPRIELASALTDYISWINGNGSSYAYIIGTPSLTELSILSTGELVLNSPVLKLGLAGQTLSFYGVKPVTRSSIRLLDDAATASHAIRKINQLLKKLGSVGLVKIEG